MLRALVFFSSGVLSALACVYYCRKRPKFAQRMTVFERNRALQEGKFNFESDDDGDDGHGGESDPPKVSAELVAIHAPSCRCPFICPQVYIDDPSYGRMIFTWQHRSRCTCRCKENEGRHGPTACDELDSDGN